MRTALALALIVTGCVADREGNPAYGCTTNDDCASGEICDRGFCIGAMDAGQAEAGTLPMCSEEACAGEGEMCCDLSGGGRACVDTSADPNNCGACGTTCGSDQLCCEGDCVDVQENEASCGACGNTCGGGLECCGGRCVNLDSSADHCGECGSSCDDAATPMCCPAADGSGVGCHAMADCQACAEPCNEDEGERCCGAMCINVMEDDANCGECGNACKAGEDCCQGQCIDVTTNNSHCGTCGNPCGELQCSNGNCCPAGETWCEGVSACVPFGTEEHCGGCGDACEGGGCNCNSSGSCRNILGIAC